MQLLDCANSAEKNSIEEQWEAWNNKKQVHEN